MKEHHRRVMIATTMMIAAATAARGDDTRPFALKPTTADAIGRAWITRNFPESNLGVTQGYWRARDRNNVDEIQAYMVSGVATCSGETDAQTCPVVVLRVKDGKVTDAYRGPVCPEPEGFRIDDRHTVLVACGQRITLR